MKIIKKTLSPRGKRFFSVSKNSVVIIFDTLGDYQKCFRIRQTVLVGVHRYGRERFGG